MFRKNIWVGVLGMMLVGCVYSAGIRTESNLGQWRPNYGRMDFVVVRDGNNVSGQIVAVDRFSWNLVLFNRLSKKDLIDLRSRVDELISNM